MTYTKYERNNSFGKRYYNTPEGRFVSVTTILDGTMPSFKRAILQKWKDKLGAEEANRQKQFAADVGTVMHENLEMAADPSVEHDHSQFGEEERALGVQLFHNMQEFLQRYTLEYVAQEPSLYNNPEGHHGYAGSTDLVVKVDGELAIGDYKNVTKKRSRSQVSDYFLQLAAYILAHNYMFNTDIKKGFIWMAARDTGEIQEFILEGEELESYKIKWLARVDQYFGKKVENN